MGSANISAWREMDIDVEFVRGEVVLSGCFAGDSDACGQMVRMSNDQARMLALNIIANTGGFDRCSVDAVLAELRKKTTARPEKR